MQGEDLVFVATCDLAGLVRGKAFPAAELPGRVRRGVGLTHSNIMMSAFGPIYETPFGTEGDLMLVPDPSTRVEVPFENLPPERFYLGDIMTTEGEPWECCPRHFLRRALEALRASAGLSLRAAFEQEFVYTGVEDRPGATYALDLFRRQGRFGEAFVAAIRQAGVTPDSFLPEYGPRQFEVTVAPTQGLRAADEAVIVREMARAVAWRLGHRAIFAPMLEPQGIGNGTHLHFSLCREDGTPVTHDPSAPYGLAPVAQHFAAGILHHMPALAAVTAPSVASYFRLTPNRWAPTWTNLGYRDRGASLRVCPVFAPTSPADAAAQFNLEYRVADATASPYMALGALVQAGVDGVRRALPLPAAPTQGFWEMSEAARLQAGACPLPHTLSEALGALADTAAARDWFGERFLDVYLRFKASEQRAVASLGDAEVCARYAEVY
ncbi:MAG: glutamine synthetase [Acetobacteraceae bacterium]|nr:glutamine synthetase [Acetobacteraceae bacterium]MBV8578980.1 glutamine synthetase [Acetobacteraceae bacterium]